MKILTLLVAAGLALASPIAEPESAVLDARDEFQTVNLVFHGGPAQYTMSFPADGNTRPTNNNIAVSIIDAPDFNAFTQCTFNTAGNKTLASSISPEGYNQILVGPPQPIISVSCWGTCIYTYGECFRNGQWLGSCCAGFCAANRCRPWRPL